MNNNSPTLEIRADQQLLSVELKSSDMEVLDKFEAALSPQQRIDLLVIISTLLKQHSLTSDDVKNWYVVAGPTSFTMARCISLTVNALLMARSDVQLWIHDTSGEWKRSERVEPLYNGQPRIGGR